MEWWAIVLIVLWLILLTMITLADKTKLPPPSLSDEEKRVLHDHYQQQMDRLQQEYEQAMDEINSEDDLPTTKE